MIEISLSAVQAHLVCGGGIPSGKLLRCTRSFLFSFNARFYSRVARRLCHGNNVSAIYGCRQSHGNIHASNWRASDLMGLSVYTCMVVFIFVPFVFSFLVLLNWQQWCVNTRNYFCCIFYQKNKRTNRLAIFSSHCTGRVKRERYYITSGVSSTRR